MPASSPVATPNLDFGVDAGAIEAILADGAKQSLRVFLRIHWRLIEPTTFIDSWAVDAVCDHLQAVSMGHITNLLINEPPRLGKSTAVSVTWPAWTWAQDIDPALPLMGPEVGFLALTYAERLSIRDAVKMRNLVTHPDYVARYGRDLSIKDDENSKFRFVNTRKGYRISTSFGGQVTGDGGDVIIIDDPHNASKADSEEERNKVISVWRESLSTRLNNPRTGAFVVVMQRLHAQDLSGHILDENKGDWVHLCLPMEYERDRHCVTVPLGGGDLPWEDPRTQEGELLAPARFGKPDVDRLKRNLGSYAAAGQLQQRPSPRAGGIIKVIDWKVWDAPKFPKFDLVIVSVDTAMTAKNESAYSACTTWGLWKDNDDCTNAILAHAWHERAEFAALVTRIRETAQKFRADYVLIENKANGASVSQEITRLFKNDSYAIRMVNPKGDKIARAYAVTPMFEDGRVWAPNRKWADDVITECALFPKGQFRDYVDSTTQALWWLRGQGIIDLATESMRERREQAMHQPQQEPLYNV